MGIEIGFDNYVSCLISFTDVIYKRLCYKSLVVEFGESAPKKERKTVNLNPVSTVLPEAIGCLPSANWPYIRGARSSAYNLIST